MEPEAVGFHTAPPKLIPAARGWQAWWEGYDSWDGHLLYDDLAVAKQLAAVDYIRDEYAWSPGDPPGDTPDTVLTWMPDNGRWRLFDGEEDTRVQLYESVTYAAVRCPWCGEDLAEYATDDLVHRTGDERPYCSGECVIKMHKFVNSEKEKKS